MYKDTLTRSDGFRPAIQLTGGRELSLVRPLIMGILNVTNDSFSDGGRYVDLGPAVAHAEGMIGEGADIIDVGGESTRPGAEPVASSDEMARVLPVIRKLRSLSDIPISIDTYHADTARAALDAGADIVNDISALRFDGGMAEVVASTKCPVVLMHMLGTPRDMQANPSYIDCVAEISDFFKERIEFCAKRGIDNSKLILDPGIGFGKRLSDNVDILSRFSEFRRFSLPLMVGASRKSFIDMLHPIKGSHDGRLGGSIAAAVLAVAGGANIVRVHDVAPTLQGIKIVQALNQVNPTKTKEPAREAL